MKNPQMKVGKVMREFKAGELKSSSGQKVTNPKQAIAIGLSEAGISKKARGGEMKESKTMMKKEVGFMKKAGAPKSMIKHEMAEAGMKRGGNVKKMAVGGKSVPVPAPKAAGKGLSPAPLAPNKNSFSPTLGPYGPAPKIQPYGPAPTSSRPTTRSALDSYGPGPMLPRTNKGGMKRGGNVKKMAVGGLAAGHKSADGIVKKGRTKGKEIKMAKGGMSKSKKYC